MNFPRFLSLIANTLTWKQPDVLNRQEVSVIFFYWRTVLVAICSECTQSDAIRTFKQAIKIGQNAYSNFIFSRCLVVWAIPGSLTNESSSLISQPLFPSQFAKFCLFKDVAQLCAKRMISLMVIHNPFPSIYDNKDSLILTVHSDNTSTIYVIKLSSIKIPTQKSSAVNFKNDNTQ